MNMRILSMAAAFALGAAMLAQAEDYYKVGEDGSGQSSFNGKYSGSGSSIGWSKTRGGSVVTPTDMGGSDFYVVSGTRLRTPTGSGTHSFQGKTLTLESGGIFVIKAGNNSTIDIPQLIGDGGSFEHGESSRTFTLTGAISVKSGSSLAFKLWSADNRFLIVDSTLTGDSDTVLCVVANSNGNGTAGRHETLELKSAAGFLGSFAGVRDPSHGANGNFVLKLTGGFGGTIDTLPDITSQVLVNIDDPTTANGIRVATTTIDPMLKTKVVLYSTEKIKLSAGDVVMTFPAGTAVDPSEFTVKFQQGESGTPNDLVLDSVENGDGTISLVVTIRRFEWSGAAGVSASWNGANWSGGGVSWSDGSDAVFNVDGAIASVDSAAVAHSVTFSDNATIEGSATLSPFFVSVAPGKAANISAPLGGTGGVMFNGGGTVTLSGGISYPGTTHVSAGTTLSVSKAIATAILSRGLELAGDTELNTAYTVLTSTSAEDDWSDLDLSTVSCGPASSFTKAIGADGRSIVVTRTGGFKAGYWTGAAGDGRISTAGNWYNGAPAAGDALDFSGVFPDDIRIIGDTGLTYGPVTMCDNVITFSGALTATAFSDTSKIAVGENGTVTLDGDLKFSNTAETVIVHSVAAGGRFVVTGHIEQTTQAGGRLYPFAVASEGAIVAKGVVSKGGSALFQLATSAGGTTSTWILGEDGLVGTVNFWMQSGGGNAVIQALDSNIPVAATIGARRPITINTTGKDGNAHTFTIGGGPSSTVGGLIGQSSDGAATIAGTGKVVCNYDVTRLNANSSYWGKSFNVNDGATLALKSGANLGTGTTTVMSGGALEVADSATVTLNGGLTLRDGAALAFNFTNRSTAPVLALASGKTQTIDGVVYVNVSTADSIGRPKPGEYVLTSGIDFTGESVALAPDAPDWATGVSIDGSGNIVLSVKPKGLIISFH